MKSRESTPVEPEAKSKEVCPNRLDRRVRAAALAAYRICTNCKKHNPGRLDVYLSCAIHMVYTIIRARAQREVPVPEEVNRSTVSKAAKRFAEIYDQEYAKLERQAKAGRRPTQPSMVSEAMRILPSARGGKGTAKYEQLLAGLPATLKPIRQLMLNGVFLLESRDRRIAEQKNDALRIGEKEKVGVKNNDRLPCAADKPGGGDD